MADIIEIICSPEEDGNTLEALLKRRGISRRSAVLLKHTPMGMTRGGELIRTIDRVYSGERIILSFPEEKHFAHEPDPALRVNKAYEDGHIIVYDKPPSMPVHRSAGHNGGTLANAFAAEYDLPFRAVNRLDADTSGLCVVAKSRLAANIKSISKVYYAVCHGVITQKLHIDAPIGRQENSCIKRCVTEDGAASVTEVYPVENDGSYTLVKVIPLTGRTHQIRVHLSSEGYPLAGDILYGGTADRISRQALHCGEIAFVHPITGENIEIFSHIPMDICKVLQK